MQKNDIHSEDDIQLLVRTFYKKAEQNKRLNFIFNEFAQVHWDEHLPRMYDFWSNVLFKTGRYRGNPYREHLPLPILKDDFNEWLSLFSQTLHELFEGPTAKEALIIAVNISTMFRTRMEMDGKFDTKSDYHEK